MSYAASCDGLSLMSFSGIFRVEISNPAFTADGASITMTIAVPDSLVRSALCCAVL
jgi:hypothetical protein